VQKSSFIVSRMAGRPYRFTELPKLLKLGQPACNSHGERIEFRDGVCWIRTEKFGEYKYRHSHNEDKPWKIVKLQREDEDCDVPALDIATLALQPAGDAEVGKT